MATEENNSSHGGGKGEIQWVDPQVSCKVSYFERKREGSFRVPVFMGLA